MSNTFKIAQKRSVRLPKQFIVAWKKSPLRVIGAINNEQLRRAYSSPHTTDEIRNAILNSIFNPKSAHDYSTELGYTSSLRLVMAMKKGRPYLAGNLGINKGAPASNLHKQILRASYLRYPLTNMFRSITKVSTAEQTTKVLNATVFVSSYLGLVSNVTGLIRAFVRHNDVANILWNYAPKEEETLLYESELKDDHGLLYDSKILADKLSMCLRDLQAQDFFIEGLGEEDGIAVYHNKLKSQLSQLIDLANNQSSISPTDNSLINGYRRNQMEQATKEVGSPDGLPDIYNLLFSALSVGDTAMDSVEALTNVDLSDMNVMDKLMRIHGNKTPPKQESQQIFTMPVEHIMGSREYFRERDKGRRANLLKK